MSKRALRLHEQHSRADLVAMQGHVQAEHAGSGDGMHLYSKSARQLLDDIGWAIYWHSSPRGNTRMARTQHKAKWW